MSSIWLELLVACALVASIGCARTTRTIVEEEIETAGEPTQPDTEVPSSSGPAETVSRRAKLDAGAPEAGREVTEKCASRSSADDCRTCCEVTSEDAAACVEAARCATLPAPDDCRSRGCAEKEACALCSKAWRCMPNGVKC